MVVVLEKAKEKVEREEEKGRKMVRQRRGSCQCC
jgi:hypothetical protein